MPAQELSEAGKYLAAAYGVFVALLLVYFAIMSVRLTRIERQIGELLDDLPEGDGESVAQSLPVKERV